MPCKNIRMSVKETGRHRFGWKEWTLGYGDVFPSVSIWVPELMDEQALIGFIADLQEAQRACPD